MTDWTVDTLKELLEREILDLAERTDNGFASQQLATEKAM